MSKSTDIRIAEVACSFEPIDYRTPLKYGGRIVDRTLLVHVEATVENRRGKQAVGLGSMPIGNVWAWPSSAVPAEQSASAMRQFVEQIVDLASAYPDFGHPIDIMYQISGEYDHTGRTLSEGLGLPERMPALAQLVAASPLDAALHDAYGIVNDRNSYELLSSEFMRHDLAEYLNDDFADEYLDRYILPKPKPLMSVYHLVGALDPLTTGDGHKPVGDGLPETLSEWVQADGLTHFKVKMGGADLDADVARTVDVHRVVVEAQAQSRCEKRYYAVDFNEGCDSAEYVVEYLNRLRDQSPDAFNALQYIEQPTHRDLKAHPANAMHDVSKLKPVILDEGLVDFEALLVGREQGYTGVAIKTCKGHTDSLLLAAAAQKFGMLVCAQDLTCPGYSYLHYASLAARLPKVDAFEANGRQYAAPRVNKEWAKRFPDAFEVINGTVRTETLDAIGLGF